MTVRELIEYLSMTDPDYIVEIEDSPIGGVTVEQDLMEPDKTRVRIWCS